MTYTPNGKDVANEREREREMEDAIGGKEKEKEKKNDLTNREFIYMYT